jgi:subtilisin-like proprotein convertase family protein
LRLILLSAAMLAAAAPSAMAVSPAPVVLPAAPGSEAEPNDSSGQANAIASGERVRAPVFPSTDVDFYKFSANAGELVFAATMTAGSAGNSSDTVLTLLGGAGSTVIERDDDNGTFSGNSSSIAGAKIPSSGTYYLRVENGGGGTSTQRPYDLYLQLRGAAAAESEPNDTVGEADPLTGGLVTGATNPAANGDFYSLPLNAGDTVFLSLDLDPERDGTSYNGRLGLALFGNTDNQLLVGTDAGASEAPDPTIPSEAFMMTVGKTGTYYAFVDDGGAGGSPTAGYRLSATVIPAVALSCRSYPSTTGPIPDLGTSVYGITVPESARIGHVALRLDLTHPFMTDLDVSLRRTGNEVGVFTDTGASTIGGAQTKMEVLWDENAALPSSFATTRPMMLQPEGAYRLSWLEGEQAAASWGLVVTDDATGDSGNMNAAELILCEEPAPEKPGNKVFSADFEGGDGGFTHSGTADEWERGLPATVATKVSNATAGLSTCAHGSGCFKTDLDGTYELSSSQDLLSPPIPLAGMAKANVSWQQWFQMESADFDHASVSVEEDGGANPRALWTWLDGTMGSSGNFGNPAFFFPSSSGWAERTADISEYAGKTIRLRFHLDSDTTVNFAGLAIDDVEVYATPGPPPGGGAAGAPVISGLTISPAKFKAAASGASASAKKKPGKKGPTGATVAYADSQASTTTFTVLRHQRGRKVKSRCKKQTKANKKAPRCERSLEVGSFTRTDVAGANKFRFSGRIKNRKLKPGKYLLEAVPVSAGGTGKAVTVRFKIVK